ncbi:hypothetical protein GYA49_06115 [Candidatus Beckwithbacteria bacterium]|nr:hypothetical protein [Candidatus Beckwithbacteria bacterium]
MLKSKKTLCLLFAIFVCCGFLFRNVELVKADELEDIARQIAELEKAKQQSEDATKPLEAEVTRLEQKITNIQTSLAQAAANIEKLETSIDQREKDFDHQYQILTSRVEQFYKRLRQPPELLLLFSSSNASQLTRELSYRRSVTEEDKKIIAQISRDLSSLEKDKQKVENDKAYLEKLRGQLATQTDFFKGEIEGARAYQEDLSQKITELTQKQKELLAKKTATFQISVGNVPLADDPASRPDYNPGFSPAFAAFSFGAPHFKGMSQYGAFGRAKEGQLVEEILKAYYGNGVEIKKDYDPNTQINVEGYGNFSLEDYAKRIYEMPGSWGDENGMEALKAQAVAARSYALARMQSSGSICASESCQVFKSEPKGGNWEAAVDATRGWVLMANGQPFSAWYASTSGGYQESYSFNGYSTPGFWDTKNGRSGWTSDAYEKIADSPWFYKGWYKTRGGTSCGRSHPWLSQEEMADIVNAAIVYSSDESSQSHLSQEDSSCFGEAIPDTWSKDQLKSEANGHGGAVTSISSVSITYSEDGTTSQVVFNTNRGAVPIDGQKFYKVFNLRAPGAIHLTSGLFNIEKK